MAGIASTDTTFINYAGNGVNLKSRFARFMQKWRLVRMHQALSQMSEAQLAEIGIARRDIPQYAEKLIYGA